jgi:hypothetical protein
MKLALPSRAFSPILMVSCRNVRAIRRVLDVNGYDLARVIADGAVADR